MRLASFVLLAVLSCDPSLRCVPGEASACTCLGGTDGAQVCGPAGTFGACACEEPQDPSDAGPTDAGDVEPDAGCADDTGCGFGEFCNGLTGACAVDARPICRSCDDGSATNTCGHPTLCRDGTCLAKCGGGCPNGFECVELFIAAVDGGECAVDADCGPNACAGEDMSVPDAPVWGLCERVPRECVTDFECDVAPCVVGSGCLVETICVPRAPQSCADLAPP